MSWFDVDSDDDDDSFVDDDGGFCSINQRSMMFPRTVALPMNSYLYNVASNNEKCNYMKEYFMYLLIAFYFRS